MSRKRSITDSPSDESQKKQRREFDFVKQANFDQEQLAVVKACANKIQDLESKTPKTDPKMIYQYQRPSKNDQAPQVKTAFLVVLTALVDDTDNTNYLKRRWSHYIHQDADDNQDNNPVVLKCALGRSLEETLNLICGHFKAKNFVVFKVIQLLFICLMSMILVDCYCCNLTDCVLTSCSGAALAVW